MHARVQGIRRAIRFNYRVVHAIVRAMNRRRIALVLTILWIVGFELMPWAHIALHDHLAHHHHDESGADVLDDHDSEVDEQAADAHHDDDLDAEVDEHAADAHHDDDLDAEVDEHGVPVHVPAHDDDALTRSAEQALLSALQHGAHSFAHHGIAVPVPAPVVTVPLPVDRRPITIAIVEQPAWLSAAVPEASARGPPCFLV
jgi:hypothetical protein